MKMNSQRSQYEQNGRSISLQSGASRDPRLRNAPTSEPQIEVCRDFVWGICNKHGQCEYRHECTKKEMESIIHFCYNYQNRAGCLLPNYTNLHTLKEEENLFCSSGQSPRVLLERHAAISAAAAATANNNVPSMEGVPPRFMTQPPPRPPLVSVSSHLPVTTVMPPPPPPAEPSAIPPTTPDIYQGPPPLATPAVPLNQPPPSLLLFDTSKPPPNLVNGAVKRPFSDNCEVGTSKLRKTDEPQVADSMCEKCVQQELRNDLCLEELEKLIRQKEYKHFLYKSKSEKTENMKAMMKYLLPRDICLAVEEYIDQGVQRPPLGMSDPMQLMMHRLLEDRLSNSSNMMESDPMQLMMHRLLEDRLTNSSNMMESLPSSSSIRDLLIGDFLNSNSTSESLSSPEPRLSPILCPEISRSNTSNLPTTSNGLSRLLNGQSVPKIRPEPPVTLHNRGPQAYARAGASASVASGFTASTSAAYHSGVPASTPAYPLFHPIVPPSTEARPPYQRAPYASTGSPGHSPASFPTASRVGAAKPPSYGQYLPPPYQ